MVNSRAKRPLHEARRRSDDDRYDAQDRREARYKRRIERARAHQAPDAAPLSDTDSWYYQAVEPERILPPQQTNAQLRIVRGAETVVMAVPRRRRFGWLSATINLFFFTLVGLTVVSLFLWAPTFLVAQYFIHRLRDAAIAAVVLVVISEMIVVRVLFITTRHRQSKQVATSTSRR